MKNFFIRIGCWFVCLFVINLIVALIAPNHHAGVPLTLVAFIVGEIVTRCIIKRKEEDKK